MSLPEPDKHAIDSFRRFYHFLPKSEDHSLVLLKAHLLVEEQVRAFVQERLVNPNALKKSRMTFSQVACLAEALSSEDIHENVWRAVKKLNQLRNDIAHELEPVQVEQQLREFCLLVAPSLAKPIEGSTLIDDFTFAVMALHNELAIFVRRRPAEVLQLVPNDKTAP
jgi:hypothetical protein